MSRKVKKDPLPQDNKNSPARSSQAGTIEFFKSVSASLKGRPEYIFVLPPLFVLSSIAALLINRKDELPPLYVVIILVVFIILLFGILYFVVRIEKLRASSRTSTAVSGKESMPPTQSRINGQEVDTERLQVYITNHVNTQFRDGKFFTLKSKANRSILMMGIGMTSLQTDEIRENYLKKHINVRLLMMNPKILLSHFQFEAHVAGNPMFKDGLNQFDALLKEKHIDEYFSRSRYFSEVQNSYLRWKEFVLHVQDLRSKDSACGLASIEMRVFNSFIPMSMTAVNELCKDTTREFIAEFLLPFSAKRIMVPFSHEVNANIYDDFIESINSVWTNAIDVKTLPDPQNI